jgi:hypothetical protein
MTLTTAPAPLPPPRLARAEAPPPGGRSGDDRRGESRARPVEPGLLAGYSDWQGRTREIVAQRGRAGSVLVVDRDASGADARLVAHLAADEPPENAALVCRRYVEEARGARPRCRRLTRADLQIVPFGDDQEAELEAELDAIPAAVIAPPVDRVGCCYRLERLFTGMSIPELRWRRHPPEAGTGCPRIVSVRDAIARLESYEPVRTLTRRALARHHADGEVSSTVLRVELRRLQLSPIVLNRRLREVVLKTAEREGLSMSEIAIRCGRIKRDSCGNESGETSWLARRLGVLPEGGRSAPTPWIHSDVLALIARRGLGISPREVELE